MHLQGRESSPTPIFGSASTFGGGSGFGGFSGVATGQSSGESNKHFMI